MVKIKNEFVLASIKKYQSMSNEYIPIIEYKFIVASIEK